MEAQTSNLLTSGTKAARERFGAPFCCSVGVDLWVVNLLQFGTNVHATVPAGFQLSFSVLESRFLDDNGTVAFRDLHVRRSAADKIAVNLDIRTRRSGVDLQLGGGRF